MNVTWSLIWAFSITLIAAPFSFGDVCQKGGGPVRIKMSVLRDKTLQFQSCSDETKQCTAVGPEGASYSYWDLAVKRKQLNSIVLQNKVAGTSGGILALVFLPLGGLSQANDAYNAASVAGANVADAKDDLKTLAPGLLTTAAKCTDVESVSDHRARLAGLLWAIADARVKAAAVAKQKLEEKHGAKTISSTSTASPGKNVVAAQGAQPLPAR